MTVRAALILMMVLAGPNVTRASCPAKCKCSQREHAVDCSYRKLTEVPAGIPNNTLHLNLRGNQLTHLTSQDFAGMPNLLTLNLMRNKIDTIGPRSFVHIAHLTQLDFSGNQFPRGSDVIKRVVCALNDTTISRLDLNSLNMTYDNATFRCMTSLKLVYLVLEKNKFGFLPDNAFHGLHDLQYISLRNAISTLNPKSLGNLSRLRVLNLSQNSIKFFPEFWRSILPRIHAIYLQNNHISELPRNASRGIEAIHSLNLEFNSITQLKANVFGGFAKLNKLLLRNNHLKQVDPLAFNLSTLQYLSLAGTNFRFPDETIFHHCPNLLTLDLGNINLRQLFLLDEVKLFNRLPKLEELYLENNHIAVIPKDTFSNLRQLTKLILSDNRLSELPPEIHQLKLTSLYLDTNRFPGFNKSTLPGNLGSHMKKMALGGNPFACNCELLWFADWLKRTNVTIVDGKKRYTCLLPPEFKGQSLLNFPLSEEDCLVEPVDLSVTVGVALSSCIVFFIAMGALSYRFRWHLGYLYFSLKARIRQYREIQDNKEYLYDAFLAYNGQDLHWIRQHVLPALEEEAGFQLCLHDRNWLPGRDIMDNIVTSIENSRKTVLVVSNAFASSQWCQLELTMAQHRLFEEDRNNMVLILLEDIDPDNMTPRLAFQMRSRTYIKWTEDPVGQALFWKKLVRTMMKPDKPFSHTTLVAN